MKKSTKLIAAAGAIALLVAGFSDISNLETSGLRSAHQAAGWYAGKPTHSVDCETMKVDGDTWALCRHWRSAPSVWIKRGDGWTTANGPALMVLDQVSSIDTGDESRPYQNLDELYPGKGSPPMPRSVSARMKEIMNDKS